MTPAQKKLALVTGGSRGIGAEICKRLSREGFHVFINFSSSEDKAQAVLSEIKTQGGSAELCQFSVSNPDEVTAAFSKIYKEKGSLSVLVNNAGINHDSLLIRLKNEDLDRILDTDLKGAIYCTREASKQMMKAKGGSIIQISSVVGESGNAGQSAYASAKSGLIGFSKSIAKELASRSVRVNVVTPGFIKTEMTEALTEAQKQAILQTVPLGDLGLPEDVSAIVAFLASQESRYITGQVIGVNGGMYM